MIRTTIATLCLAVTVHSGIDLSGTILNGQGAPLAGARVELLDEEIAVYTDAEGKYTFAPNARVASPARTHTPVPISVRAGHVGFELTDAANVSLTLLDMKGRVAGPFVKRRFPAGTHSMALPGMQSSTQLLLLHASIDRDHTVLKSASGLTRAPGARPQPGAAPALHKRGATADTLRVSYPWYYTRKKALLSYSGIVDISLDTMAFEHGIVDFHTVEGIAPGRSATDEVISQLGAPTLTNKSGDYAYHYYPALGLKANVNTKSGLLAAVYIYGENWRYKVAGELGEYSKYPYATSRGIELNAPASTMDDVLNEYGIPDAKGTLHGKNTTEIYPRYFRYLKDTLNHTAGMEFYFAGADTADYTGKKITRITMY